MNPGGEQLVKDRTIERHEAGTLPSKEQCEILQDHKFVQWFKEGMWMNYLKQSKGEGLTEEQRNREFQQIWQEGLEDHIKYLLDNNELQDWQQFVADRNKPLATEPAEAPDYDEETRQVYMGGLRDQKENEIIVPPGKSDERGEATSAEKNLPEMSKEEAFALADKVIAVAQRPENSNNDVFEAVITSLSEARKYIMTSEIANTIADRYQQQPEEVRAKIFDAFDRHEQENKVTDTSASASPMDVLSRELASSASEAETKDWWEDKVFINRDSGDHFSPYLIQKSINKITLKSEKNGHTITKNLDELSRLVGEEGSAWSMEERSAIPKPDRKSVV